jgi:hypothetical protein
MDHVYLLRIRYLNTTNVTHIWIRHNPCHITVSTINKYIVACQDKQYNLVVMVVAAFNTIRHIMIF